MGCCVQMSECRTDRDEEAQVVSRIRERHSAGIPLSDMAVLFRTAAQGKVLERALVRSCKADPSSALSGS